jgi:thiamine-phosphate pyrophosphorylase
VINYEHCEGGVRLEKKALHSLGLYPITDKALAGNRPYVEIVREVLLGGARIVQLRDKRTPFEELVEIGRALVVLVREFDALLIVNDNPYLAREIDADGVHLGQLDMPVDIAREVVGREKIIGLSTHSKEQAIVAQFMDVDYIGIGPIFPTTTKVSEHAPLGCGVVRWAARALETPFVAIGGINRENICEVVEAGARNVAVISAIMAAENIRDATRSFIEAIGSVNTPRREAGR